MQSPHATPLTVIATSDLQRLHQQLEAQQDALARQADLIAQLTSAAAPAVAAADAGTRTPTITAANTTV